MPQGEAPTKTIGFWMDLQDGASVDTDLQSLQGVSRFAESRGWEVLVNEVHVSAFRSFRNLRELEALGGQGLIIAESAKISRERMELPRIPAVAIVGSGIWPNVPSSSPNNRLVGESAARHLLRRGYQQFAYCGPDYRYLKDGQWESEGFWARDRYDGFSETVRAAGYGCELFLEQEGEDEVPDGEFGEFRSYYRHVREWLKDLPRPVGLMACGDRRGRLVIEVCGELGLSVPRDVAVVGASNKLLYCSLMTPQLSSVDFDYQRIGFEAAGLLNRQMEGEPLALGPVLVPPKDVVARGSTDMNVIRDRAVASALRYIQEHYREPIGVEQVARHAHLSSRQLERRFRQSLGFTMISEIRRLRLRQAQQLMRESDLRQDEIAQASGFRSSNYMSKVFRDQFGMSPSDWRAAHVDGFARM